jgi:hypothetical protein
MDDYLNLAELCMALIEANKLSYIEGSSKEPDINALMDVYADMEIRVKQFFDMHPDGKAMMTSSAMFTDTRIQINIEIIAEKATPLT